MKKIIYIFPLLFLFNGCFQSVAVLTSGASSGNLVNSSIKSAASFGVKHQTGKTPMEHALSYVQKHNPNNKKEKCISFLEKTNSEVCAVINNRTSSLRSAIQEKSKIRDLAKKSKIENLAKKSSLTRRR